MKIMGVRARGQGGGGGATAFPNSGKTVGKIRAKQEEIGRPTCVFICVKFRANQPLCSLNQRVPIRPWWAQLINVHRSTIFTLFLRLELLLIFKTTKMYQGQTFCYLSLNSLCDYECKLHPGLNYSLSDRLWLIRDALPSQSAEGGRGGGAHACPCPCPPPEFKNSSAVAIDSPMDASPSLGSLQPIHLAHPMQNLLPPPMPPSVKLPRLTSFDITLSHTLSMYTCCFLHAGRVFNI